MRARITIEVPDAWLEARVAEINREHTDDGDPIDPPLTAAAYVEERLRREIGPALYGWPIEAAAAVDEAAETLVAYLNRKADGWEKFLEFATGGDTKLAAVAGVDFAYRGPCDFVLQHGAWYDPQPYPLDLYPKGGNQLCYANALCLACAGEGLTYVEGYAVMAGGGVVQHAWNVDANGRLLDSTWLNTGHAYCGVTFTRWRADDCTWNGDATVLDDHHRGWPLLRHPWDPEAPDLLIDDSARARVEQLRAAALAAIGRARALKKTGPVHVTQESST